VTTNLLGFHRVPIPPEVHRAEIALASLLNQSFLHAYRKTTSSNLVSWTRSMSGVSVLIKLLMASSLTLLPIPLQFQEMAFIIYVSGGPPWSHGSDFSTSLTLRQAAFPALVGCPVIFPCTFPTLFSPDLICDLLWIS